MKISDKAHWVKIMACKWLFKKKKGIIEVELRRLSLD